VKERAETRSAEVQNIEKKQKVRSAVRTTTMRDSSCKRQNEQKPSAEYCPGKKKYELPGRAAEGGNRESDFTLLRFSSTEQMGKDTCT
jgi:hypothetical protein